MATEPPWPANGNYPPALIPLDYYSISHGQGSPVAWFIAFLIFPFGPFIYLAKLHAIRWWLAIVFVLASAAVINGLISVLVKTNGQTIQDWVVSLLNLVCCRLGMYQYFIGERHWIWSPTGKKIWRGAGWFMDVMLVLGISAQVAAFHLNGHS